jgi:hypothetical protein
LGDHPDGDRFRPQVRGLWAPGDDPQSQVRARGQGPLPAWDRPPTADPGQAPDQATPDEGPSGPRTIRAPSRRCASAQPAPLGSCAPITPGPGHLAEQPARRDRPLGTPWVTRSYPWPTLRRPGRSTRGPLARPTRQPSPREALRPLRTSTECSPGERSWKETRTQRRAAKVLRTAFWRRRLAVPSARRLTQRRTPIS